MKEQLIKLGERDLAVIDSNNTLIFLASVLVLSEDMALRNNYRIEQGPKNIIVNI